MKHPSRLASFYRLSLLMLLTLFASSALAESTEPDPIAGKTIETNINGVANARIRFREPRCDALGKRGSRGRFWPAWQ